MTVQTDWPELACLDEELFLDTYKVELTDTNGRRVWVACSHESEVNKLIAYTSKDNKYTAADVYHLTSKHTWPSVDIQVDCVEGAVLELNELPRGC